MLAASMASSAGSRAGDGDIDIQVSRSLGEDGCRAGVEADAASDGGCTFRHWCSFVVVGGFVGSLDADGCRGGFCLYRLLHGPTLEGDD